MVDITEKNHSLRYAKAQAILKVSKQETIDAIQNKTVPKGDVLEFAKVAGLFAVKKTAELIPDCHPLPIEYTKISYEISGLEILIFVELKTVYKTGVEVEAMHGASVVALTMYDMLKPIDKNIEIGNIKLLEKTGGKSDFKSNGKVYSSEIIVFSDNVASGKKQDKVSDSLVALLSKIDVKNTSTLLMQEDLQQIRTYFENKKYEQVNVLIIAGGTGVTPKDKLPQLLSGYFEVSANSLMEASRILNMPRDAKAMLSNSVAGIVGTTLVLNVPGSSKGAIDSVKVILPQLRHILENQDYFL
ncbi:MAG: bifunctional molybdenum cofactor biosynthesis protein MoaC/MoaB [Cytophagales bacterium]